MKITVKIGKVIVEVEDLPVETGNPTTRHSVPDTIDAVKAVVALAIDMHQKESEVDNG